MYVIGTVEDQYIRVVFVNTYKLRVYKEYVAQSIGTAVAIAINLVG